MYNQALEFLAQRVRAGDAPAAAALRHELRPSLEHLVRWALRPANRSAQLAQRIRCTAQQVLAVERDRLPDGDSFVLRVASSLCDTLVERLQGGAGTIRHLTDTLRDWQVTEELVA